MAIKQKHIFVVDDDELISQMLCDHLSENPVNKVSLFKTGEECLKNLHLSPDYIILDYHLNSVDQKASDGMQILQQIKKYDSSICVIMLSSQAQYGKALQTIVKGAMEYVLKNEQAFERIDQILAK